MTLTTNMTTGTNTKVENVARRPAEKEHDHEHGGILDENTELIFATICGGLLLIGWLLSWTSISPWIPFGCYLAACFFGGYFTFLEALENILARRFEIDFLRLALQRNTTVA